MAIQRQLSAGGLRGSAAEPGSRWVFSWPLLAAAYAYLHALFLGKQLLMDGDTYWHIAAGQWILANGSIPKTDPFSHSMPGTPWTAHEWLSELVLAGAHDLGGWTLVTALTALAFAATFALLTRALLKWVEPIYALLFTMLALAMTSGHLLARPHILALPLLMVWTIELVRASDARRTPPLWMLALMVLWANLHGGFTFGLLLVGAFGLEAVLQAAPARRVATARSWALFFAAAFASSLVTPHGVQGIVFTWHVLFNLGFVLDRVGEWRSPDFHTFNVLELWLLAGLALVLHQGLRLPPVRLLLVLGVLHMALKHVRYIEVVGLLAPLFVARPFAEQWSRRDRGTQQVQALDRFFTRLAAPAGAGALLVGVALVTLATAWTARARPVGLPEAVVPAAALEAVHKAGITGPVLNSYGTGGYLIYKGIPVFIDGRADMYGEALMKEYVNAMELRSADALPNLLAKYRIAWTLLEPENSATAMLDHLPGWRRLHADKTSVVHVRDTAAAPLRP
jgi:hypothetical protein